MPMNDLCLQKATTILKLPSCAIPVFASLALVAPLQSAQAAVVFTTIDLTPSGYTYTQADAAEGAGGASNGVQVGAGNSSASGTLHALLWTGTAASVVDLNPTHLSGFTFSGANGASGGTQVGYGDGPATGPSDMFTPHALLWMGTAASAVDLNPAGYDSSVAYGASGNMQVGEGDIAGVSQALLWQGTAASAVDLNPAGYDSSVAYGASGNTQVGYGTVAGVSQALLWTGTAASAVDLNPAGYTQSVAHAAAGNTQVGEGDIAGVSQALLWQGTAASAVDLNPTGYASSVAYGASGNTQVGYGTVAGVSQALLWTGTAASAVDLNQFLPVGYTGAEALGIDSSGDVIGYGIGSDSQNHPLLWVPEASAAPEPSEWSMLEMIGLGLGGLIWCGCRKARVSRRCDNP